MKITLIALFLALPLMQENAKEPQHPEITHSADTTWVRISPNDVGAAFSMPEEPEHHELTFDKIVRGQIIIVHQYRAIVNDGTASFVFAYNDLQTKMDNPNTIRKTLEGAVRGANARVLGSLKSVEEIRHGRHVGREFVYIADLDGTLYKFSTRIVLVGQRLFQLNLVMPDEAFDERMARKFFDSFKLTKRKAQTDLPPQPRKKKSSKR